MANVKGNISATSETTVLDSSNANYLAGKKYTCDITLSNKNTTNAVSCIVKIGTYQVFSATLGKQLEASSTIALTQHLLENQEVITVTAGASAAIDYRVTFLEI